MTSSPGFTEWSAQRVVALARALSRRRIAVACIGLVMTLVAGVAYIADGALHLDLAHRTMSVKVLLAESGGLLPNQDVTLRGVPIGRVESVQMTPTGVVATTSIDAQVRIPQTTTVRVSALSMAGEQYLDFEPQQSGGPSLTDGATIGQQHTTVPVSLPRLLTEADGALAQLNPEQLRAITAETRLGPNAPQKLAALLDGGTFLISTLDSVLPQTVTVLRDSRIVLATVDELSPGLDHTAKKLTSILHGVNKLDGGFRRFVDHGAQPMQALDKVIADNSDTMVQLLGNLTTIAQLSYVRVPALKALFPTDRGSVVDALGTAIRDGGIWGIMDLYPRYACDYNLPRLPPSQPDFPEPYLYTYCANNDPAVLIRGARNAPRPPGDDTAGPPPGADPLAKADPTPRLPNSIPTPYAGPLLPHDPPN